VGHLLDVRHELTSFASHSDPADSVYRTVADISLHFSLNPDVSFDTLQAALTVRRLTIQRSLFTLEEEHAELLR
jgi:hypothetical protein